MNLLISMNSSFKRILMGLILLIFILEIGIVCATENIADDSNSTLSTPIDYSMMSSASSDNTISISEESNNVLKEDNIVDFNSTETSGVNTLDVQFNDKSTGNITSWYWDFGDGFNSSDQNASHTYSKIGSYNVNLTVTYLDGTTNYLNKNNYINVFYYGDIIKNPDFEISSGDDFGWIFNNHTLNRVVTPASGYSPYSGNKVLQFGVDGSYIINNSGIKKYFPSSFGQYINFDYINSISFYVQLMGKTSNKVHLIFNVTIDDVLNQTYDYETKKQWFLITVDTSNITGVHFFNVVRWGDGVQAYFDSFSCVYNELVHAESTYDVENIIDNTVNVQFNNKAYGSITDFLWDFGDGETSTEVNPTHTFAPGTYTVTLTASNANYSDTYSMDLVLEFPTVNGQMYATLQDAIDAAVDGDEIDIPTDFEGTLNIAKNLTLNFNGNKLNTSSINVVDGAEVSINDVEFDGNNVLSTDDSSKLNINYATATDANVTLSEGNIILDDSSLENSYLTITNANTEINYCNVNAGGIIVNGGKSKITNSEFTDCDVAITQNDGELNITGNSITDNKIGVNVTNGTGNINFNAIYSNTEFGLIYKGNINIDNNWFGKDEITYTNGNETPTSYADVYQAEETTSEVINLILTINSPEIMGANKEYSVLFDLTINSMGQNTSEIGSLKPISLDVTSDNGELETLYLYGGIGEAYLLVGSSASEGVNYVILGQTYDTESIVVTNPEISINVTGELKEGSTATVNVNIPYATGNVTIIVNTNSTKKELVDNAATCTIDELSAGKYTVVVLYDGDDVFDFAFKTDSFDVEAIDNTIKIEVNGSEYTVSVVDGNATKLVDDLEDDKQKIENLTTQLEEAQANATDLASQLVDAQANATDLASQLVDAQANATDLASQLVDAQANATDLASQLVDAQSNVTKLSDDLAVAKQNADNLTSQLSEAQKQIKELSSDLVSTNISANNLSIKALNTGYIQVTLNDANGAALVNKTVNVIINGVVKEGITGDDGVAKISVKYSSAGTYYATVTFAGDDSYKSSISTSKVVVSKKATKITAPKKTFKVKTKTKKVKITLKSGSTVLKSKKITLKVNGKTYTVKTNKKGVATVKVTKLTKKGTFKYTVKFAGDKAYKAISKKGKITVK